MDSEGRPTTRGRRKLERRDAIVNAAGDIIAQKGYARTTMEQIAQKAGVGVATVYKHFGTKANILEAIIRPSLELAFAEAEKVIAQPPSDPGVAVAALIDRYRYLRDGWKDRRLLQVLSMLETENVDVLRKMTTESNARTQQQIRDLLLVLKGRGDIDGRLPVDDAASIVFCIFNQHYEFFVSDERISAEKLFADLRRRLQLLFTEWRALKRS